MPLFSEEPVSGLDILSELFELDKLNRESQEATCAELNLKHS